MAGLSVLLSVAVGVVTNLLTDTWSWTLGVGFAVLVCGLVAVTVKGTTSGSEADETFRIEAASGGRVVENRSTVGGQGRLRLRATRRGTIMRNITRLGRGSAVLKARGGEISDNETTTQ